MIKGVLFDLDGTLLDLNVERFLNTYMTELAPVVSPLIGRSVEESVGIVNAGVEAMMKPHPGYTNKDAFDAAILKATGTDIREPELARTIDAFYLEVFPTLQGESRPFSGTRLALETCLSLGLPHAIATQPVFPLVAAQSRLKWAGIDDFDLSVVSSYENSTATKPMLEFFVTMAERIDVDPEECIMVGDDAFYDMPASALGMKTFYVGDDPNVEATWRGDLEDLACLLCEF